MTQQTTKDSSFDHNHKENFWFDQSEVFFLPLSVDMGLEKSIVKLGLKIAVNVNDYTGSRLAGAV